MMKNLKPWVVVTNPGTDIQAEDSEFVDYSTASKYCASLGAQNIEADLMKRLPDGFLTCEF